MKPMKFFPYGLFGDEYNGATNVLHNFNDFRVTNFNFTNFKCLCLNKHLLMETLITTDI